MHRGSGAVLVGIVVLIGVGCGSSDSDSSTKAEFVRRADAICKKGIEEKNTSLEAGFRQMGKKKKDATGTTAGQEELIADFAVPPFRDMVDQLEALEAPDEGGDEATALITAISSRLKEIEDDPSVAIEETGPFEQVDRQAAKYGFDDCAQL